MPPVPPAPVVRAVEALRARVQRLGQRMVPGSIALLEMAMGSILTQALYVAAELRVADALAGGPRTAADLAPEVGADPEALYRLLRMLAGHGVFTERADSSFALTGVGEALRADHPATMRDLAVLMGHPLHWEDWSHLIDSVRTGEPSLPVVRGMGAFDYFQVNPEYGQVFMAGMGNMSRMETEPVVAAYDFSRFESIVDVGGGGGGLLTAILRKTPGARGVLFDSRADDFGAEAAFAEAGVADRCTVDPGGLFDPVTPDCDAYILKHIVHDWPEAQALEILANVRKGIRPDGRVLLMEFVTPEGNGPHPAKTVDLWLMLLVGGKERTETQYAGLLGAAGFALERVVRTASGVSIVEGRPV